MSAVGRLHPFVNLYLGAEHAWAQIDQPYLRRYPGLVLLAPSELLDGGRAICYTTRQPVAEKLNLFN